MELWIRSQDRKCFIKAKIIKWENGCLRGATDDDGWYYDLGKYKKERALEVLDEIQRKIEPEYMLRAINGPDEPSQYEGYYEEKSTYVYEMPED